MVDTPLSTYPDRVLTDLLGHDALNRVGKLDVSALRPSGPDTSVQFNDGGVLGGDSGLVWDKTNNNLTIADGGGVGWGPNTRFQRIIGGTGGGSVNGSVSLGSVNGPFGIGSAAAPDYAVFQIATSGNSPWINLLTNAANSDGVWLRSSSTGHATDPFIKQVQVAANSDVLYWDVVAAHEESSGFWSWNGIGLLRYSVDGTPAFGSLPSRFRLSLNSGKDGFDTRMDLRADGTNMFSSVITTSATQNTLTPVMVLQKRTDGTPGVGTGIDLRFNVDTAAGNTETGANIQAVTTDITGASEDFDLVFKTMAAGTAAAERLKLNGTGLLAPASAYLNFGVTQGDSGYGFRDNAGATEVKSSGGGWSIVRERLLDNSRAYFVRFNLGTCTVSIASPAVVTRAGHGLSAGATVALSLPLDAFPSTYASSISISIASPGVVTVTGHPYANNDPIAFFTTGALPTGITAGTTYYVKNAATNTFEISATPGGASINTSGSQSGVQRVSRASTMPTGITEGEVYYVLATGLTANSFQISATAGGAAINTSGTQAGRITLQTGNDNATGLTYTQADCLMQPQKAVFKTEVLDFNNKRVTIYLDASTYLNYPDGEFCVIHLLAPQASAPAQPVGWHREIGGGQLYIRGLDDNDHTKVILRSLYGFAIYAGGSHSYTIAFRKFAVETIDSGLPAIRMDGSLGAQPFYLEHLSLLGNGAKALCSVSLSSVFLHGMLEIIGNPTEALIIAKQGSDVSYIAPGLDYFGGVIAYGTKTPTEGIFYSHRNSAVHVEYHIKFTGTWNCPKFTADTQSLFLHHQLDADYGIEIPGNTPTIRNGGVYTIYDQDALVYTSTLGINIVDFPEISTPANPSANIARLYSKDSGGTTKMYFRDSAGTETELGAGGGASLPLIGTGATVTTNAPLLDLSQTWNAGGVTFTGMKLNITNTASAAGSMLMDWQIGGVSRLKYAVNSVPDQGALIISGPDRDRTNVTIDNTTGHAFTFFSTGDLNSAQYTFGVFDEDASVTCLSLKANVALGLPVTQALAWADNNFPPAGLDLFLYRDAGGALAQRNGVNAQSLRVYNTYTGATNYERGVFDWSITSNTLTIGTEKGSGGGTGRTITFMVDGKQALILAGAGGNHPSLALYDNSGNRKTDILAANGNGMSLTSDQYVMWHDTGNLAASSFTVGIYRVANSVLGLSTDRSGTATAWIQWAGEKRVTSDFGVTSSTTLVNVTGLSVDVQAGRTYSFEAELFVTDAAAGGVQAAIAGTATATAIQYTGWAFADNAIKGKANATALGTAVASTLTTETAGIVVRITGVITVNAAGTLTVQMAQNTSNGTATTAKRGSKFVVHDMP